MHVFKRFYEILGKCETVGAEKVRRLGNKKPPLWRFNSSLRIKQKLFLPMHYGGKISHLVTRYAML